MIKHVFWDFNGTLLDDAPFATHVINTVLKKYGLPLLQGVEAYRSSFCFPVRKFYTNIGITDEMYDQAALDWVQEYKQNEGTCALREGVLEVLQNLQKQGIQQYVISLSQIDTLKKQLEERNILHFFKDVLGLSDIHARSKVELFTSYINANNINVHETLLIGDTDHDQEVAKAGGAHCLMLLNGHQSKEKIVSLGCDTLNSAQEIIQYIQTL